MITTRSHKTREGRTHLVLRDGKVIGTIHEVFHDVFYRTDRSTRFTSLADALASFG